MSRNRVSPEPEEPAELAADAALAAITRSLGEQGLEPTDCLVLVTAKDASGEGHGATAANMEDARDVLALLLGHAEELAKAMGLPFHIGTIEGYSSWGQG